MGRSASRFFNNHKNNSSADTTARDSAIVFSIALQHGADLENRPASTVPRQPGSRKWAARCRSRHHHGERRLEECIATIVRKKNGAAASSDASRLKLRPCGSGIIIDSGNGSSRLGEIESESGGLDPKCLAHQPQGIESAVPCHGRTPSRSAAQYRLNSGTVIGVPTQQASAQRPP